MKTKSANTVEKREAEGAAAANRDAKDAARYRWLRSASPDYGPAVMSHEINSWGNWYWAWLTGDKMDAEIDAAMAHKETA